MSDPYRIDDLPSRETPATNSERGGNAVTTLLITVAAVCVGINTAVSLSGHDLLAIPFGAVGLLAIVILVIRFVRGRRS